MLSKKTSEDYLSTSYMKHQDSFYVGDKPIQDNIAGVDTVAEDIAGLDEAEKVEGDKPWLLEDGSFNPKFSNTLTTSSNFKEEWEEEGFDFSEYKKAREDWSEGKTKENLDWIVTGIKDLFKSGEASAADNPRFKEKK